MARILLTDDEADFAEAMGQLLASEGHDVTVASSGAAAIEHMRQTQFDVVITDVVMPSDGGVVVVGLARVLQENATIIAMSGYFDDMSGNARFDFLQNLGVRHLLRKPVQSDELIKLIASLE